MSYIFSTPADEFEVTVHGNGWAYEVTRRSDGESLWFQDDDAEKLQQDTSNFESEYVLHEVFNCLCE